MRKLSALALTSALAASIFAASLPAEATEGPGEGQWQELASADAPISNPLKGFLPFAPEVGSEPDLADQPLPYTMEFALFPVNSVVTDKGRYNWENVDKMLDSIASRGHQTVLRFYLDCPKKESGVPSYLIKEGIDTSRKYSVYGNTDSFSPNYDDPRIQEMLVDFIKEFGNKYDGDPRIGYITAGLIGFWGEDHTYPMNGEKSPENPKGENWMPSSETRARLVEAWDDAFDTTPVQFRHPTAATKAHHMGYHDDSFAYSTLPNVSWHFLSHLKKNGEENAWQQVPIGGELYPSLQTCIFSQPLNCPDLEKEKAQGRNYDAVTSIKESHATWLINHNGFSIGYTGEDRERAAGASALMGYTLQAKKTRLSTQGTSVTVETEIANTGLAPFYASWPIEFALVDSQGHIVSSTRIDSPLPSLEPQSSTIVEAMLNLGEKSGVTPEPSSASGNGLTAVLRVVNPLPNGVPLAFANEAMGETLPGYLTLGKVSPSAQEPSAQETPSQAVPSSSEQSDTQPSPTATATASAMDKESTTEKSSDLARTGRINAVLESIFAFLAKIASSFSGYTFG